MAAILHEGHGKMFQKVFNNKASMRNMCPRQVFVYQPEKGEKIYSILLDNFPFTFKIIALIADLESWLFSIFKGSG